ncbi:MAG: 2-amino-4-hydroxy-6-hydroxymethyldihydropteridine diphosphokinase [Ectothiorhodospiraceae bacterium]|nr:2-amino-4-hydroxy-6-hydroxymethyldihydropteridine diphosphokinase [Chromatiales bacterium]MCP5153871.1 2-amino-4-hydroxy-6-hydroxymethyldihydropteridine diphosphokinase [Ectothiorhodospiraceae bacterium]
MPGPVRAYVGLGSNLVDPPGIVRAAMRAIDRIPSTRVVSRSRLYRNAPLGPPQPDYVNAVVALDTMLDPEPLLDALQAIERAQGRIRDGERWGPRTLDLDMLLYGSIELRSARLTLPHPGIASRRFVLQPMHELAPELDIPGIGAIADALAALPDSPMVAL